MVPRTFLTIVVALSMVACEVTPQDIETWKGTQRGPGKIVAVLVADKYPIDLRTRAAIALFEMNREDTNGLRELEGALPQIAPVQRAQIVAGTVARVRELLGTGGERPNQLAIRAKDAGYVVYPYTAGSDRALLEQALLSWILADFNGRFLLGDNNSEKLLRLIGAPAARALVGGISKSELAVEKIAQLVMELGDPPTKVLASQRLVAVATEQATEQTSVTEYVLSAMQAVGGRAVVDYVLSVASQAPPQEAEAAARLTRLQKQGLAVIERHVTAVDLGRLCDIALNARLDVSVRDQAFDRLQDLRNPAAIPRLWQLLSQRDERLRWRGGELILEIGGAAVVQEFLRKLPTGRNTEYLPQEIGGYSDRMSEMRPPPTEVVRTSLVSESWVARVISIQVIGRIGAAQDMAQLQQLVSDTTRQQLAGGGPAVTVSRDARQAIERLQGGQGARP